MNTQPEPIEHLIMALIAVTTEADDLDRLATKCAQSDRAFQVLHESALHARARLRRTIEGAVAAVDGIHGWIPPDAGVQPREWTTDLRRELHGLRWLLVSSGPLVPIDSQDAYLEAVARISQRIGFLEALDLTDFEPAVGDPVEAGQPQPAKRGGMSVDEANMKARELMAADPDFAKKTAREWALEINCSLATVQKTLMWKLTMEKSGRGLKNRNAMPKASSLPKDELLPDNSGELNRLVAEQKADYEPSAADPDPSRTPPRARKKV